MLDDDHIPEAVPIALGEGSGPEEEAQIRTVPCTVITGFLGSGKTSLVRYVLTADHGMRVAVIMNEYGETVESSYFKTPEGTAANLGEWVELSNGCLCCSVKSEFVQAIESLMAKQQRNFDYILIETTGLANPGPVAAALWTDRELEAGVQLDSIVTVVDCININRQLHDPRPEGVANEAQVQIAYADVILLNKMDLCEEEAVARAEADIRAINSSVPILRTTHCQVDLGAILHRKGYAQEALDVIEEEGEGAEAQEHEEQMTPLQTRGSQAGVGFGGAGDEEREARPGTSGGRRTLRHVSSGRSRSRSIDREHGLAADHHHPHHDKDHLSDIQTVALHSHKPLNLERFRCFMDKLLWDRETHPEDIYRVKGVLSVAGSAAKHLVQAVYELYHINTTCAWAPGEERVSTVVVIGRHLKHETLHAWLAECEEA